MSFYHPSKLVTDVLSQYVEFDQQQLRLGIWSGDLCLKNVELKREAIYPLLNDLAAPKTQGKPPLNLKLVSGTVGHMRIRIPWKRLVWGQGDVRLQISDVTLAVAYESREETATRIQSQESKAVLQEDTNQEDEDEEKRRQREFKQDSLREAERCMLQGLPIPNKTGLTEKKDEDSVVDGSRIDKSTGALDRWLRRKVDGFAWRFFAGLQASIRNVRVVIVQDSVEVGAIFHSLDILAGKEQLDVADPENKEGGPSTDDAEGITETTPPPNIVPEGEYDDGEHVDKTVKMQGFGVFVRRENKEQEEAPPTLKFSTSVTADDYILRPTEANVSFSFFYPYPSGYKKRKRRNHAVDEEPTTPTTATVTLESVSMTSSKARRGKREKQPLPVDETKNSVSDSPATPVRPTKRVSLVLTTKSSSVREVSISETTTTSGNRLKSHSMDVSHMTASSAHRRISSEAPESHLCHPSDHRPLSGGSRTIPLLRADDGSSLPPNPSEIDLASPKPKLEFHVSFGDVKTLFSSRHYELILTLQCTVERVRNGRPNKSIASCFGDGGPEKMRSVYVDAPAAAVGDAEQAITSQLQSGVVSPLSADGRNGDVGRSIYVDAQGSPTQEDGVQAQKPLPRPSTVSRAMTTGQVNVDTAQRVQLHLQLQLPKVGDKCSNVVRSWWRYAYNAVLFEVAQRRIEETAFVAKDVQFDWEKQKYRRKEYVELYIATRLESSSVLRSAELKALLTARSADDKLLKIEDELAVEQILLYRAIARSLRVRGLRKMPDSVRELHGEKWLQDSSKARRSATTKTSFDATADKAVTESPTQDRVPENEYVMMDTFRRQANAVRQLRSGGARDFQSPARPDAKQTCEEGLQGDGGTDKESILGFKSTREYTADGRTVRSFQTAKTRITAGSVDDKEKESRASALQITVSVTFFKIEVLVYQERQNSHDSLNSMRPRPAASPSSSIDVLASRIRHGLQLNADSLSDSSFSDLSILSDDFDEAGDLSGEFAGEIGGDDIIMSSADFLSFGQPSDIILHAAVSCLTVKTHGHSGGPKVASLTVDQIVANGHEGCHLLSLLPASANAPLEEVHVGAPKKERTRTSVAFVGEELTQDKAIFMSLVWKHLGLQAQCDLSKIRATADIFAAAKLVDFFSCAQIASPQPLIGPSPLQELRTYVLNRLAVGKGLWNDPTARLSRAVRIHGVECRVPCMKQSESLRFSVLSEINDEKKTPDLRAELQLTMKLVEYYDGYFLEDICALSNESWDETARLTQGFLASSGDVDWPRRQLTMLDLSELVTLQQITSSRHSFIAVAGIRCFAGKDSGTDSKDEFLDLPIDIEALLTRETLSDLQRFDPDRQITAEISPIRVVLSKMRLDRLSQVLSSFKTSTPLKRSTSTKMCAKEPHPRLAALSSQVLLALDLRIWEFRLACVDESSNLRPSLSNKEIIMEESLSDFLSVLSCFHLEYPTDEALEIAKQLCLERLIILGVTIEEANDIVNAARLNFLAGMEEMKQTQSQVILELADASHDPDKLEGSSTKDYRQEVGSQYSATDLVSSVEEMSQDDSEESIDIIETTLKNAVERTMSSFGQLLQRSLPTQRDFSEFLVVHLSEGANLSAMEMFYDCRVEGRVKSLSVRDASGCHLLSIKPRTSAFSERGVGDLKPGFPSRPGAERDEDKHLQGSDAISFSYFILDQGFDFGDGGLPLAILGSHEDVGESIKPQSREQLYSLCLGNIELLFNQDVYDKQIQSFSQMMNTSLDWSDTGDSGVPADTPSAIPSTISARASTVAVTLTSDELAPFCRFDAKECMIDNIPKGPVSANRLCVNLEATACLVLDLTPEGYGYPDILIPLAREEAEQSSAAPPSLRIQYLLSVHRWKEPSRVDVQLHGVRLFVLRRFVNEAIQYLLSTRYGLGLLQAKYGAKPIYDVDGNPPPPLQYEICVLDSSIVLPRTSTSIDMVAIEVERFKFFNSYAAASFTGPTDSSDLIVPEDIVYKRTQSLGHSRSLSKSSKSDFDFFDCVEQADAMDDSFLRVSNFRKEWIARKTVFLEGFRIFTSLPNDTGFRDPDSDDPIRHRFYRMDGKPREHGPVYGRLSPTECRVRFVDCPQKPRRFWHEITPSEASLEIITESAPHLRLLITDKVVRRNNSSVSFPLQLDMRMSELCLLLSVWYSNMQELPVMFPYALDIIREAAEAPRPCVKFPEYGTQSYLERVKCPGLTKSDFYLVCNLITIRGSFDEPGYFSDVPQSLRRYASRTSNPGRRTAQESLAFKLRLDNCALRVTIDSDGVQRVACGASRISLIDERRGTKMQEVIFAGERKNESDQTHSPGRITYQKAAWADLSWGFECNGLTFGDSLPQAFQATVVMTPGWCQINVGIESLDGILSDLSPIWILLDYFSSYFKSGSFGNPIFEVTKRKEDLKRALGFEAASDIGSQEQGSLNIDLRLWLLHPYLCISENVESPDGPTLIVEGSTGFWYHYTSIGQFSSQEMGSTDLSLQFSEKSISPAECRSTSMDMNGRVLLEGFSFGLRMDSLAENQHTDYFFTMPFFKPDEHDAKAMCSVLSPPLEVKPIELRPPIMCIPYTPPTRALGCSVCEVTILVELIPIVSSIFQNLLATPDDSSISGDQAGSLEFVAASDLDPSFSLTAHVDSLRMYAVDPVLKMHFPIALVCLSTLDINVSQLSVLTCLTQCEALPEDFQVTVKSLFWADYFKLGVTRSWEPLLEPFNSLVLYERSKRRGNGLTLNSNDAFYVNVTGALLTTLDEVINSLLRTISESFGGDSNARKPSYDSECRRSITEEHSGFTIMDQLRTEDGSALNVYHHIPTPFRSDSRIAFSFRNLTGQGLRVHQLKGGASTSASRSVVTYLENLQSTTLSFDATVSILNNLIIVEVPFPGFPDSQRTGRGGRSIQHEVDVQLPGYRWVESLSVDLSGRKFDNLVPRSEIVLSKVSRDWRLENAMKILTEGGLENGGRLIAARSIFEVRNKTSHRILLSFHPDPTRHPSTAKSSTVFTDGDEASVEPEAAFYVPMLLIEASLQIEGNHLGSLWIRPTDSSDNKDLLYLKDDVLPSDSEGPVVGFCSRPVQLAKLVHESALIFQGNKGEDLDAEKAMSGVQVSCPVFASDDGAPIAPFCYVVEIRRSPLVKLIEKPTSDSEKAVDSTRRGTPVVDKVMVKNQVRDRVHPKIKHGPVSYSLGVYPPLIVENLLPKHGRFELLHATRRTVLWFGDLKPGERVPIHSVGLDAPLLLMVNLGFCRSPVGEGALVHHGSDVSHARGAYGMPHGGLKSIGKAVKKNTKKFGKTLTAIAESPDKRGQGKLFLLQNPQFSNSRGRSKMKKGRSRALSGESNTLGLDTVGATDEGSKVHGIEHEIFDPSDVVSETEVVDSVGQRLTLKIENTRGGGGQRRISVYCPFWIVNTTEHSLLYKQEMGMSFVSGTVVSPDKDGSKPVDDSDRNYALAGSRFSRGKSTQLATTSQVFNRKGIFSGTPGALATPPGKPQLSPDTVLSFLDNNLPLDKLTQVAFMFNFQEDVLSMGKRVMCVQLADGTGRSDYSTSWSQGFSLDSVGVNQIVSMHTKDGRALEIAVTLAVAPGFLSGYTKIVRFAPRFVLVNHLDRPVRIWQDSSLLHPMYEDTHGVGSQGTKGSKWRFRDEQESARVSNQYECLFGRTATLDEDNVEGIAPGTNANRAALYIATAGVADILPFHLPDTRSDRLLRIDLGGAWNLTSSFSADGTGEYTFKVSRATDLRMLSHVTTRASPQYKVLLPPQDGDEVDPWDGELGVWFETDWGDSRRIIVKGTKKGSFAFNHTDIHLGDELLRVDEFNVSQMTFSETMKVLKDRISYAAVNRIDNTSRHRTSMIHRLKRSVGPETSGDAHAMPNHPRVTVTLTFRTLEERLRRVRIKALKARRVDTVERQRDSSSLVLPIHGSGELGEGALPADRGLNGSFTGPSSTGVKVEMRMLHQSVFVVVRPPDPDNPPFRIENRALENAVLFRQRGCSSYPWNQIKPGESVSYSWEEPMRVRKLTVRVGQSAVRLRKHEAGPAIQRSSSHRHVLDAIAAEEQDGRLETERKSVRAERLKQLLSVQYVKDEEKGGLGASRSVKLEVIGYRDTLPLPETESAAGFSDSENNYLNCEVDTDGLTRVLIISDAVSEDERTNMQNHVSILQHQIKEEEERKMRILELKYVVESGWNAPFRLRTPLVAQDESKEEVTALSDEENRLDMQAGHCSDMAACAAASKARGSSEAPFETSIEDELDSLDDFPEDVSISRCHQVLVEVMEAAGLRSTDASGICNPYCELITKDSSRSKRSCRSHSVEKRNTYFVESTSSPKWTGQVFIFDVPAEAAHVTRGHSALVRVRNFHWVGNHPSLGHTTVHLSSLRNQQELVGWYPLVGRAARGDLDESLANYSRGSVKMRLQWIHSVPGLIDYFLMLSERRLINLRQSVDGMKGQIIHSIETEKTGRRHSSMAFGSFRIPTALSVRGISRAKRGGHGRRESRMAHEGYRDGKNRSQRRLLSRSLGVQDSLRYSREQQLWQLYFETEESRKRRRSMIDESADLDDVQERANTEEGFSQEATGSTQKSAGSPWAATDDAEYNETSLPEGGTHAYFQASPTELAKFDDSSRDVAMFLAGPRTRAYSLPYAKQSSERLASFRDDSGLINHEVLQFSRLARTSEHRSRSLLELKRSLGDSEDSEEKMFDSMDALLAGGFIHHKKDSFLHHDHLSYHLRRFLVDSSVRNVHGSTQGFQAKSNLRVSQSIREFKSWTAAQALFNDAGLDTRVTNDTFHFTLRVVPSPEEEGDDENQPMSDKPLTNQLQISQHATRIGVMADQISKSRSDFERACRRSIGSVMNTGGRLTIRPMTALYLPDTGSGTYVKLRYGTEVVMSKTVEAKVSPTWTRDTSQQVTPYAHIMPPDPRTKNFEFCESDLQVYVDSHVTSGSLRLSVGSERLNKSKTELGILKIPLAPAISCCLECMEEVRQHVDEVHQTNRATGVPAYVRWFPLMNPKESVAVDGDMGLSSRPTESEKERDNMFARYFTPCIKLAFIWQPEESVDVAVLPDGSQLRDDSRVEARARSLIQSPLSCVTETYFNADIGRISAALIDSQRAMELISISATGIDLRYSVTKPKTISGLFVNWLQVDYQGDKAREPVVLAPTPGEYSQPTLQFLAVKDNVRTKNNIESYEYVWMQLQEMDLTLEESWMFDLWDFFTSIARKRKIRSNTVFTDVMSSTVGRQVVEWTAAPRVAPRGSFMNEVVVSPTLSAMLNDDHPGTDKLYVERLLLGLLKINISYLKGKRTTWEVNDRGGFVLQEADGTIQSMTGLRIERRGSGDYSSPVFESWSERTHDEDMWTEAEADKYANLPNILASIFPSVSDAPIRLQGKVLEHVFEDRYEIVSSIMNYYQTEILKQIYKIIGALDFVGNPSMVLSSFVTGVRDFFVTPSVALLRSPGDPSRVGVGFAKGTISLFSNSASGLSGFVSKMTAVAGQVTASLSLDEDYQRWHRDVVVAEAKGLNRQWKRRGVQSIPKMVARPIYDVVSGVVLGVVGVVYRPYVGAKRNGCAGFTKGVASGVLGVVAKPLTGVLDAFSHFTGSVYDVAKSVNLLEKRYEPPKRLRLPSTFGPKTVLLPYDPVAARSVLLLRAYPIKNRQGKYGRIETGWNEIHIASEVLPMEPGVETYAVVSSHRIVLFKMRKENGGVLAITMCWEVDFSRESSVSSKLEDRGHNGVALVISAMSPKKKTRIGKVNFVHTSPHRNAPNSEIEPTPSANESRPVSQSSLPETPASIISLDEGGDDLLLDNNDGLGTKTNKIWDEADEMGTLVTGFDDDDFRANANARDGEVVEWFTILAEFQQRGQLTRIHNAICCITGEYNNIIDDRSVNRRRRTEGYTSFGELYFGKDRARDMVSVSPRYDRAVCKALNHLPWMHDAMFQMAKNKSPEDQLKLLTSMRKSWILSREVSATLSDSVPIWFVDACAKATFVPHEPPPLPAGLSEEDGVVSEIYNQLKYGNISYDQALHLLTSHAKSAEVSTKFDDSDLSVVTDDLALDRLFDDDTTNEVERNMFYSTNAELVPSELAFLDAIDRPARTTTPAAPIDFQTSKSSLPYLDPIDSHELQSLADKSLELDKVYHENSNLLPSLSVGSDEGQSLTALLERHKEPMEMRSLVPSELIVSEPESSRSRPVIATADQTGTVEFAEKLSRDVKLDRMEGILEQLLIITARQAAQQNYQATGRTEDPEMLVLRQEMEELRAQVQSKVTNNDREQMVAALRKEVRSLKQQLREKDEKAQSNVMEVQEKEEASTRPTVLLEKLGMIGSSAQNLSQQVTQGLKAKHQGSPSSTKVLSPPTIFEGDEEEDDQRESFSM